MGGPGSDVPALAKSHPPHSPAGTGVWGGGQGEGHKGTTDRCGLKQGWLCVESTFIASQSPVRWMGLYPVFHVGIFNF